MNVSIKPQTLQHLHFIDQSSDHEQVQGGRKNPEKTLRNIWSMVNHHHFGKY